VSTTVNIYKLLSIHDMNVNIFLLIIITSQAARMFRREEGVRCFR